MFNITVKTLDGVDTVVEITNPEQKILDLKEKISSILQVPVSRQRLIYQGRLLKDNEVISECNLENKTIHLVERAPPTSVPPSSNQTTNDSTNTTTSAPEGTRGLFTSRPLLNFVNMITQDLFGNGIFPSSTANNEPSNRTQNNEPVSPRSYTSLRLMLDRSENILRQLNDLQTPQAGPSSSIEEKPSQVETTTEPSSVSQPEAIFVNDFDRLARVMRDQLSILDRTMNHVRSCEQMFQAESQRQQYYSQPIEERNSLDPALPAWNNDYFRNVSELLHMNSHMMHLLSEFDVRTPTTTAPSTNTTTIDQSTTDIPSSNQENTAPTDTVDNSQEYTKREIIPPSYQTITEISIQPTIIPQAIFRHSVSSRRNNTNSSVSSATRNEREPRSQSQGPPLANPESLPQVRPAINRIHSNNFQIPLLGNTLVSFSHIPTALQSTPTRVDSANANTVPPQSNRTSSASESGESRSNATMNGSPQTDDLRYDVFLPCRSRFFPRQASRNGRSFNTFRSTGILPTNMEVFVVAERPIIQTTTRLNTSASHEEGLNDLRSRNSTGNQQSSNWESVWDPLITGGSMSAIFAPQRSSRLARPVPPPSVNPVRSELIWLPRLFLQGIINCFNSSRSATHPALNFDLSTTSETDQITNQSFLVFLHEIFDFISPNLAHQNYLEIDYRASLLPSLQRNSSVRPWIDFMLAPLHDQFAEFNVDFIRSFEKVFESCFDNIFNWILRSPTNIGFNSILSQLMQQALFEIFTLMDLLFDMIPELRRTPHIETLTSESLAPIVGQFISLSSQLPVNNNHDRTAIQRLTVWFFNSVRLYERINPSQRSELKRKVSEKIVYKNANLPSNTNVQQAQSNTEIQKISHLGPEPLELHENDPRLDMVTSLTSTTGNYLVRSSEKSADLDGEQVPESWIDIIRNDEKKSCELRDPRPISAFSDAYLNGMPAKRRKIINEQKSAILERNKDFFYDTLYATLNPDQSIPDESSQIPGNLRSQPLVDSFRDVFVDHVARRLRNDSDFIPERYPKSDSVFIKKTKKP